MNLKDKIAEFPNFPKKGILFRDFSPILKDPSALSFIADEFAKYFHPKDVDFFVKKLSNEKFTANAPPQVLEKDRGKLADGEEKLAILKQGLEKIQALK